MSDPDDHFANPGYERSLSRGREFHSTGRGGAGNIRRSSTSCDAHPVQDGPEDFSDTRGREMNVAAKITHTGRGGAGNIRSPARDTPTSPSSYEREVIAAVHEREKEKPHSTGRGGFGNISPDSRPVESERGRTLHSSGRGGVGNITSANPTSIDHDEERGQYHREESMHSTGRGGLANLTSSPAPRIDSPARSVQQVHSAGRGGAGNIHQGSVEEKNK